MTDVAAAILVQVAVENNEQLKAKIAQADVSQDVTTLETILLAWWRSFRKHD